jgi:hypothetical protein
VWFLNATWNTIGQKEAENLWNYVHKAQEIDIDNKVCLLSSYTSRNYMRERESVCVCVYV